MRNSRTTKSTREIWSEYWKTKWENGKKEDTQPKKTSPYKTIMAGF